MYYIYTNIYIYNVYIYIYIYIYINKYQLYLEIYDEKNTHNLFESANIYLLFRSFMKRRKIFVLLTFSLHVPH